MIRRVVMNVFALTLIPLVCQGVEPRPTEWKLGQEVKFKIARDKTGTIKVLGTSTKTRELYVTHLTATVGTVDAEGRIPLTLKATRVTGEVPVVNRSTFQVTPTKYDSATAGDKMPTHHFAPAVTLMKRPLTLLFEKSGKVVGVTGTKEWGADTVALLKRDFSREVDFPSSLPLYEMLGSESAQKYEWDGLLTPHLPDDFLPGEEWSNKRVWSLVPYYLWVNGKHQAQETDDGGLKITSTLIPPKTDSASIKLGPQEYIYSTKNGTGEGEIEIDNAGWIKKSQNTVHFYLKMTLKHLGQEIPMDDYYIKLITTVEQEK